MRSRVERGVDYDKVNVMAIQAATDEMLQLSGQDLAPVIEVGNQELADFDTHSLEEF